MVGFRDSVSWSVRAAPGRHPHWEGEEGELRGKKKLQRTPPVGVGLGFDEAISVIARACNHRNRLEVDVV